MAVIDYYQPPTVMNWKILRAHGMDQESQDFRESHGDNVYTLDQSLIQEFLKQVDSPEKTDRWARFLLSDGRYDWFVEQKGVIDQRYRSTWRQRDAQTESKQQILDKAYRKLAWFSMLMMVGMLTGDVVGFRIGFIYNLDTFLTIFWISFLPMILVFLTGFVVVLPLEIVFHYKTNPPARSADFAQAVVAEKELLLRTWLTS